MDFGIVGMIELSGISIIGACVSAVGRAPLPRERGA